MCCYLCATLGQYYANNFVLALGLSSQHVNKLELLLLLLLLLLFVILMHVIYNYINETNTVPRAHSAAAVLYLQSVLHVMLFRMLNIL